MYANTKDFSQKEAQAFETLNRKAVGATFSQKFAPKEGSATFFGHGFRSTGAHGMPATLAMSDAFEKYWKSGVIAGNRKDIASLGSDQKGHANPMFAFSSAPTGEFAVHYGSDPLLGFHLAEVFDRGEPGSDKVDELTKVAKSQFKNWCFSFAKYLHNDAIKIIMHCGEAINLCYELQSYQPGCRSLSKLTRLYNGPWKAGALTLTEPEGISLGEMFDVVDTSNLNDHVGILNILPAAALVLRHDACSVLYTESLLLAAEDTSKSLGALMFSDISVASLILGIAPVGHLLGTTTDSVGAEVISAWMMGNTPGQQRQLRMRIPWKWAQLGDRRTSGYDKNTHSTSGSIGVDSKELAEYFFGLYLKMFAFEDLSSMMSLMKRQIVTPLAGDLRFYSRMSLVALLRLAKNRVATDWGSCIDSLLEMIGNDHSLIVGSNSLQELYMHLHLSNLWENPSLKQNPKMLMTQFGRTRSTNGETGLLQHLDVPPLVHVALVVPRSKLGVFSDESLDSIGTPALHIAVAQEGLFENSFFAFDCFFGRLKHGSGAEGLSSVEEDTEGWRGQGDLIATCPVPAFMLLTGPRKGIRVALVVNTAPSTVQFSQKLGIRMRVYECGLDDEKHLHILRKAPGSSQNKQQPVQKTEARSTPEDQRSFPFVSLNHDGTLKSISIHAEFSKDSDECRLLKEGVSVTASQLSPCTMNLQIGKRSHHLVYPYPIDGSCCKTKIARKQSWVEVAVPISPALMRGGFDYDPFPVVMQSSKPVAWSLGRTNINQQPLISTSNDFGWLQPYLGLTVSQSERSAQQARSITGGKVTGLVDLKESITLLFLSFVGQNPGDMGKKFKSFTLAKNKNSDTLLFANSMRHDRDTGSILLDCFVVPLTEPRIDKVLSHMQKLVQTERNMGLNIGEEESVLWKQLLPALVERCRFSWEHKETCEYMSKNRIPLSTAHGEMPICTCGEGKDTNDFPAEFKGFAKLATRIAIAPLSAVPYVESMIPRDLPEGLFPKISSQLETLESRTGQDSADNAGKVACSHCGTVKEGLKVCARCEGARYCNHACQKAAWKAHKKECRK